MLALNVWGTSWPLGGRQTNFGSAVVLTEPVPELLEEIGWTGGEAIIDGRMFLHYFRTTPDGRVLMGSGSGRLGLGDRVGAGILDDLPAQARAERGLRELLPALAAAPIAARWSGPIDVSADKLPRFGTVPGTRLHYGAGYSGNGVGPSWLGGQILASLALGARGRMDGAAARRPPGPAAAARAVPLCRRQARPLGHAGLRGGRCRRPAATGRGTRRGGDPASAADADRDAVIRCRGGYTAMSEPEDRYSFPEATDPPSPLTEPSSSLLPAIAAGLVAAIVGGIVWGLIVKISDYEVGIVAWGIGFVAGTAVVLATRGAKGRTLQVIAVVSALLGILLGKYLSYAFAVQEQADAAGVEHRALLGDMFRFFRENLDDVFGLFDLLWVGFAVFTRLADPASRRARAGHRRPTE